MWCLEAKRRVYFIREGVVDCAEWWGKMRKGKHLLTLATWRTLETLMRRFNEIVGKEFTLQ